MPTHRERAQNACERFRKLTELSKKARMEPEAEESAISHAIDDGSETNLLDDTVLAAQRITLKGPRQSSGADSVLTPAPATTRTG